VAADDLSCNVYRCYRAQVIDDGSAKKARPSGPIARPCPP
jgi:hypothetical protein